MWEGGGVTVVRRRLDHGDGSGGRTIREEKDVGPRGNPTRTDSGQRQKKEVKQALVVVQIQLFISECALFSALDRAHTQCLALRGCRL